MGGSYHLFLQSFSKGYLGPLLAKNVVSFVHTPRAFLIQDRHAIFLESYSRSIAK